MECIFVRQGYLAQGRPPVAVAREDRTDLCSEVRIQDDRGRTVATVRHDPEGHEHSGATVYIEVAPWAAAVTKDGRR